MAPGAPRFPPRLKGLAAGPADPAAIACAEARRGCDAGLVVWSRTEERLRCALVLAPEEPISRAAAALPACMTGLQNALGVLAPPETAVHLGWSGSVRLNGGHVGGFRLLAPRGEVAAVPAWLVVAWELTLRLPDSLEPGQTPDWTALDQEGCGEIPAADLLEAYARHALHWLSQLEEPGGRGMLGREWKGLAWKLGQEVTLPLEGGRASGIFLGVDEDFGMLLRSESGTRLVPLAALVEEA